VSISIAVAIQQQAQAGARAHFDEGKGSLETSQNGEQDAAPPDLIGLCSATHEEVHDLISSIENKRAERLVVRGHAAEESDARKQEVRLTLGGGNEAKKLREVRVLRHTEREPLVQGRPPTRLASGELTVQASHFVLSHFRG
jgi:hypothetical protein